MAKKITFRYTGERPIEELTSDELFKNIDFIHLSKIDNKPIYETKNTFDQHTIDVLNNRDLDSLRSLLRVNKLKKLIDYSESTISTEFLNFWYNNEKNLYVLMPFEEFFLTL
jgi:hypothetical protein